jgi:hypothetical protein
MRTTIFMLKKETHREIESLEVRFHICKIVLIIILKIYMGTNIPYKMGTNIT